MATNRYRVVFADDTHTTQEITAESVPDAIFEIVSRALEANTVAPPIDSITTIHRAPETEKPVYAIVIDAIDDLPAAFAQAMIAGEHALIVYSEPCDNRDCEAGNHLRIVTQDEHGDLSESARKSMPDDIASDNYFANGPSDEMTMLGKAWAARQRSLYPGILIIEDTAP